jgi:DNA-binding response OmpR family regulator
MAETDYNSRGILSHSMTKAKKVLLAEDNAQLRGLYTKALTAEGFDVVAVADGLDAFEAFLAQGPFDAVVTDCDMPRLTGMEFIERLRNHRSEVPALLMSGRMVLDRDDQERLGVGRLLAKPFGLDSLVLATRRLVSRFIG